MDKNLFCIVSYLFLMNNLSDINKVIFINLDKQNLSSLLCNFWINTCTVRREMIHSSAVSNRWKFEFAIVWDLQQELNAPDKHFQR